MNVRKIIPDDGHDPNGREEAGRVRKEGGRATQRFFDFTKRGANRVQSDRSNHEYGHGESSEMSVAATNGSFIIFRDPCPANPYFPSMKAENPLSGKPERASVILASIVDKQKMKRKS